MKAVAAAAAALTLAGCATTVPPTAAELAALAVQVRDTELAFARSMAERDHAAFVSHLSEHAVFFGGRGEPMRGRDAVAAGWKPYFDGPRAPFSWAPDRVEVLADGTLAHSSGPVRDPDGKPIARFNSIWRQESPGLWRIVFDKGEAWRE
jgi:ketosteroid isomerase-like protein